MSPRRNREGLGKHVRTDFVLFPIEKEERTVAAIVRFRNPHRAPDCKSVIIAALLHSDQAFAIRLFGERLSGVELLVNEIFIRAAMETVRAGLHGYVHNGAAG